VVEQAGDLLGELDVAGQLDGDAVLGGGRQVAGAEQLALVEQEPRPGRLVVGPLARRWG
jgi:hypothetical protein